MRYLFATLIATFSAAAWSADFDSQYQGLYRWGPEVHTFSPCDKGLTHWVSFGWAGAEMHESYKSGIEKGYEPMYIEFRGHLLDEEVDGFATQYDGLIRISEVYTYSFEIPEACGTHNKSVKQRTP